MDLVLAIEVSLLAGILAGCIGHMPPMTVRINEMEAAPFGYGYAWSDHNSLYKTCMIVPFNMIFGAWRALYFRCVRGFYFQRLVDRTEYLEWLSREKDKQMEKDRQFFIGATETI